MIRKYELGLIFGFKVGNGEMSISHLQFADDTTIFCGASIRQIGYLHCILRYFELVLGLIVNLAKSEVFQVGDVRDLNNLALLLGCKITVLPSIYLGLPLRTTFKSKRAWNPMVEKIGFMESYSLIQRWQVNPD